jgi:hypothetical protein
MQKPIFRRRSKPTSQHTRFTRTVKRTLLRVYLPVTGILLLALGSVKAQQGTDYAVHANIIYHFTKYIDWPEDKKSGEFVIGIMGETPLYDALKTFTGNKMAGGQRIVIKKISTSGSYDCHILFVSEDATGSLKKVVTATSGTSTLLVTETDGAARKGSCINFIIVDDRLKLEINKNNIERRDLNIASELLKLGILVK